MLHKRKNIVLLLGKMLCYVVNLSPLSSHLPIQKDISSWCWIWHFQRILDVAVLCCWSAWVKELWGEFSAAASIGRAHHEVPYAVSATKELLLPLVLSPRTHLWGLQMALYFRFSNWKCVGHLCNVVWNIVGLLRSQGNLVRASCGEIDASPLMTFK